MRHLSKPCERGHLGQTSVELLHLLQCAERCIVFRRQFRRVEIHLLKGRTSCQRRKVLQFRTIEVYALQFWKRSNRRKVSYLGISELKPFEPDQSTERRKVKVRRLRHLDMFCIHHQRERGDCSYLSTLAYLNALRLWELDACRCKSGVVRTARIHFLVHLEGKLRILRLALLGDELCTGGGDMLRRSGPHEYYLTIRASRLGGVGRRCSGIGKCAGVDLRHRRGRQRWSGSRGRFGRWIRSGRHRCRLRLCHLLLLLRLDHSLLARLSKRIDRGVNC